MKAVIAPAAAGLALASGGVAIAQGVPIDTQLTIKSGKSAFSGKVKSAEPECVASRSVSVFRKKNGKDKKVGTDSSNANGKWKVGAGGAKAGKYYAKAKQATDSAGDICLAAKSSVATRTS
jgi:hypothetical protein